MEDGVHEEHENPAQVAKTLIKLADELDDINRHLEVSKEMIEHQAEKLGSDAFNCSDDAHSRSFPGLIKIRAANSCASGSQFPTTAHKAPPAPPDHVVVERPPSIVPTSHVLSCDSEGYNNSDISAWITEHTSEIPRERGLNGPVSGQQCINTETVSSVLQYTLC